MKMQMAYIQARDRESVCVNALPEVEPDYVELFTPWCFVSVYDERRAGDRWIFQEMDQTIARLLIFDDPDTDRACFASMSHDGEFTRYLPSGNVIEQVPEAGLKDEPNSHGRIFDCAQIGGHVYCCGSGGQFARRELSGVWNFLAPERRMSTAEIMARLGPRPRPGSDEYSAYARKLLILFEESDLRYTSVNGLREDAIYLTAQIAKKGHMFVWNGAVLKELPNPTDEIINGFFFESERDVWAYGRDGTLMRGNHLDGFNVVSHAADDNWLIDMGQFKGVYYLVSNAAGGRLLMLDGSGRQIPVPGMPETQSVNAMSIGKDALWIADTYAILRFDGQNWERFTHPQNRG